MASLTGNLVAETYKALLKTIDNDILTASEKQITDGLGGGSNVFIDSQGFLRANKYKVTNGLATQFLKADGSLDSNAYLTSITGAQVITALGYTPVPTTRTITINGETHNLAADNTWTIGGTAAIWGNITGTLSNQTDLQNALNAKFDDPTGNTTQYIDGTGALQTFPTMLSSDNLIKLVRNQSGGTMTAGTIVYINGATGNKPTIAKALATSDATSAQTYGMVQANIANNADGYIVVIGNVNDLDTHSLTEGAQLYLSSTTAGAWTTTKQYAPAHLVYVGIVLRSHPTQGIIGVKIQNGYELDELHDVSAQSPTNNDGIFFEASTSLWKNKSIATVLGYTPQAQLSGTGFVKASGTTISYDNSTYLTTGDAASTYQTLANLSTDLTASATKYPSVNAVIAGLATKQPLDADLTAIAALAGTSGFLIKTAADTWSLDTNTYLTTATAASTYQRLDKMVSNLLASDTEYPNSNAVIAALALKANAANPVFTGNMTISGAEPKLFFTDTDNNPDYTIFIDSGIFYIYDQTAGATRFSIGSTGNISAGVGKSITAGSFVKESGTASQFLKADGSIDSSTYVSTSVLADYLLSATAATTYQRLDKMVSNLLASDTEYPNSNAVLAKLALKADAANPVFTGDLSISGATPRLYFVDTDQNPDYTVFIDSGFFYIYDQTAGATRFSINSSGNISTGVGKSITAGSFVRDGGTSSQYLLADGSVTTGPNLSLYLPLTGGTLTGTLYGTRVILGSGTINSIPSWMKVITTDTTQSGIGSVYNNKAFYMYNSVGTIKLDAYDYASNVGLNFQIGGNGGNTIFWNTKLLVGTTTDSGYTLDVNGSARFVSGFTSSSGTFSTTISATGTIFANNIASNIRLKGGNTDALDGFVGANTDGTLYLRNWAGTYGLTMAGTTGAATFTNTVNATSFIVGEVIITSNQIYRNSANEFYVNYSGAGNTMLGNGTGNVSINAGTNPSYRLHVGGTLGVTGAATFSSSITTYGGLDITGIGYFRGSNNSTDNIRFYNTDGNYAYIRTTLASNTNNTWFDTPLGATLWLGWDNPGQARTASAYSQVYIGTGRGEVNESVRLYRGSIEGRDIFGNINYRIATSNTLGANTFFNYGNVLIGTSTDGGYKLDVTGTIRAFNSSSLIVSMSSNPANDAVIAARWTSGVGLEMRYNPNNALCYFDSTYPLTSNQVFGDMQFRVNAGGTMTPALTIKANNSNIGLLGNTTPEYRIDLCGYNAEFPSEVIRFGAYNGPSGGGGSTIGSGIMWKPYYSGYTRRSAGIMQIAENNYFRSGIGFFTNDNANTTSDWSERLRIYSAGNATFFSYVTATAFYESSDFRLKTLIESNPIIAGIEKLEAKLYEKNGKIELGYFAQDAELIMPYAVTKNEDGFLNLSYREVHTAKIARLEQRVAELEKQLNLN